VGLRSRIVRLAVVGSLAASSAGTLLLGAGAAGATPTTTTTTYTAVASWTPSSGSGPNVSLQATEVNGPTSSELFFFVNESTCTANGFVGYSYLFEGPAAEIFAVSPTLANAVLVSPAIKGTLTTTTSPECNGQDLTTVSVPARAAALGRWWATGPPTTTFPGEVVRTANAVVFLAGPRVLNLSHLGPPTFAQISSFTS
jgi:hypothetical protein